MIRLALLLIWLNQRDTYTVNHQGIYQRKNLLVDICDPTSPGCFDWPFMCIAKIIRMIFVMAYEINLLHMVVLIWCGIFKQLYSQKYTDTEY